MHQSVDYRFLNIYEKNHEFLSSIKRNAQKRKVVPFSLPHGVHKSHDTIRDGILTCVVDEGKREVGSRVTLL